MTLAFSCGFVTTLSVPGLHSVELYDYLINYELEGICEEAVVTYSRYHLGICLERLKSSLSEGPVSRTKFEPSTSEHNSKPIYLV
jgi:hypothetical protein